MRRIDLLSTMRVRKRDGRDGREINVLYTDWGCLWNPVTGDLNDPKDGELIIEALRYYRDHAGSEVE